MKGLVGRLCRPTTRQDKVLHADTDVADSMHS
jgi:hypothetical protein